MKQQFCGRVCETVNRSRESTPHEGQYEYTHSLSVVLLLCTAFLQYECVDRSISEIYILSEQDTHSSAGQIMTMACLSFRVLAAHLLLISYLACAVIAEDTTTTTTLTSTTTVLTTTVTITTHGTTTTATETIQTTAVYPYPSMSYGSGSGSYSSSELKSHVLNSTNYFRAQHQADALSWDNSLAVYAQNHAEKCIWEHSVGPYPSCLHHPKMHD